MRPTLSYVRGLRDVLEIPTKEERRAYYILEERKRKCIPGLLCVTGLVGAVATQVALNRFGYDSSPFGYGVITMVPLGLGMASLLMLPLKYLIRDRNLEKAARSQQENRLARLKKEEFRTGNMRRIDKF